ncbi:MAG: sulfurtransferase [Rhizobiaceae bacterium]|nr:sulfurtransferase [Rhizobiaceae bacterium]
MNRPHFITPDALEKRLGEEGLSIICNFMFMPGDKLDGRTEFNEDRIPGAVYFDLDEIADQSSPLPHMIASPQQFSREMGALGISENDLIIIYDGPGLFSSARIWWNLQIMGAKNVRILEGGYDRWISEDRPIDDKPFKKPPAKTFNAVFDADKVVNAGQMLDLINNRSATILDARSAPRFLGEVEEPRPGLRLGHMPGATSLPFSSLIENGTLIENDALKQILEPLLSEGKPVVTTCGSGVTAAVLALALISAGYELPALFDGSWSEWGDRSQEYPINKGE